MISSIFIRRPRLAIVVSIVILVAGLIALRALPVAQFPDIVPPQVRVATSFPGASAADVEASVAQVLESQVNGVEGMIYMKSTSGSDGSYGLTVSFEVGTDPDLATVNVMNRVNQATSKLPSEVQRIGVTVKKQSSALLQIVAVHSPKGTRDELFLTNYGVINLIDRLARVPGVGQATAFGTLEYAMRVWFDTDRMASLDLTPQDIATALKAQNIQAALGRVGAAPIEPGTEFQYNIATKGRLVTPEEFGDVVVRADPNGALLRVRDVARIELGAKSSDSNVRFNGKAATGIAIYQSPGANAIAVAEGVRRTMEELKVSFPDDVAYEVMYDTTVFVEKTIESVKHTLLEAFVLVALVVFLFLGKLRATLIPIAAVPVALVGTFAAMLAFGFTANTISLLALVLAIGIVVDDAIVVVENVERYLAQGMSPKEAAHKTMDEVGGALIAIALVLCAVFIPVAYITGLQGAFYKQFAITIASATLISAFVSLTLSPALAAILLKPHGVHEEDHGFAILRHPLRAFFDRFNHLFERMSERYGALTARLVRIGLASLIVYGLLIGVAAELLRRTPTGLVPTLDRGYLIAAFQLPPGASLDRTDAVMRQATNIILGRPGVESSVVFTGFDGATFTNSPNAGVIFVTLKSFEERYRAGLTAVGIRDDVRAALAPIKEAFVFVLEPPAVPGIGTGGGLKGYVQDRGGVGLPALEGATWGLAGPAMHMPGVAQAFTLFNTRTPQIYADIDRTKAEMIGVPISRVFETMSIYLGSVFVNDFNILGRTYRVMAQADNPHRLTLRDLSELKTRSATGEMTPLGAIAAFKDTTGPFRVPRYNLYPAAEVQVDLKKGVSSGQGIAMIEALAKQSLPQGFGFEWTEIALQEKLAGNTAVLAFGLAVVFVFLLLAALYESVVLPLAVILIVPMCILAAMSGVALRGLDRNILVEIGLVVLIGLAAKNAILIVEFARQGEDEGKDRFSAAIEAARTRLRPILMTSLAFILGVLPLAVSHGAGAEMRQSLGVAVFSGMLGVTVFGLVFTPVFYVLSRALATPFRRS